MSLIWQFTPFCFDAIALESSVS